MDFWKRIKHLFAKSPSSSSSAEHISDAPGEEEAEEDGGCRVLEHKLIERSESEQAVYADWLQSDCRPAMLAWIREQYDARQNGAAKTDAGIDFLTIASVNGFVLHFDAERWDSDDFRCLFDYLAARVQGIGYRVQVSETKTLARGTCREQTQRHYLKPPRRCPEPTEPAIDQQYGNVMITLCALNRRWVNLKFSATHYNDRLYLPPRPFAELIDRLCSEEA